MFSTRLILAKDVRELPDQALLAVFFNGDFSSPGQRVTFLLRLWGVDEHHIIYTLQVLMFAFSYDEKTENVNTVRS